MNYYKEKSKYVINAESEIHYAIQSSYKNAKFPHSHDFYELLLIIKGSQLLRINGKSLTLNEASLIIIRPNDIHHKEYIEEGQHINVAFPKKTIDALFNYLGEGFPKKMLLEPEVPPYVVLSRTEKNVVKNEMEKLNLIQIYDKQTIRTQLRILLAELFTKYFIDLKAEDSFTIPSWVEQIMTEMKKRENFSKGLSEFVNLSGKSHEHLCRIMKKQLNITPTQFINEQKLNYVANLLIHSDMDILTISLEAGFENLSHFYHLFKKRYDVSPAEFRRKNESVSHIPLISF